MIRYSFMGAFVGLVLTDYLLARFVFKAPWLAFALLTIQAAIYFFYHYLKSPDRYLKFQPRHFTRSWHQDIQSQQNEIWQDLHENLESFKDKALDHLLEELQIDQPLTEQALISIREELDKEFQVIRKRFKEQVSKALDQKKELEISKDQMKLAFVEKTEGLKKEFSGFMYYREQESKKDLKRMVDKLSF